MTPPTEKGAGDGGFPKQHQAEQPGKEHAMRPQPEYIRAGYVGARRLAGKACLVTGGDSGIGRAVAVHFAAEEAAAVAIVHHPSEERDAEETRRLVEAYGTRCTLVAGDVTEAVFPAEAVRRIAEETESRIDVLVNNASGQWPTADVGEITLEQFDRTFRTNLYPYFLFTRASLDHMQAGACIINTTSITAYRGSGHLVDYSATKGAITSLTRSLSLALVGRGIRVNGVAPGPIWTPLIPASFDAERVASFGANTPMGRAGQPSEVAPCYVFLGSADASYMTGQILHPNGGQYITT